MVDKEKKNIFISGAHVNACCSYFILKPKLTNTVKRK